MELLLNWVLSASALMLVAYMLPGVHVSNFKAALIAAIVVGLINALLRPVLALLTLPLSILTLGLFYLVLNGLLFWLAGSLTKGFQVSGFWAGLFGAILYGVINWALGSIVFSLL
ncbi:membrane protein [Lampropedia cohaerens]|uniref:Membrane protein n=1 Tax=Lampropedia cohaerens TaxID=1610491 RepID=A0A0U1Q0R9_9BURK|nr:phage holin family protein [Lampropedia cohaerens]KKW68364.1 membrane protein [Lampropedia cohaerens]